jgi:sulfocyanin
VFAAGHTAATPQFLTVKGHSVTLTLIAAYNNNVAGFNFDGDGNGKLVVSVPAGYSVNVVFSNKSATPHSALFTQYSKRTSTGTFPLAFKGASSPNATSGIPAGKTQKFSFVASKVGTYALVCAMPGHDAAGMWDTFKVTRGGKPSIKL